MLASQRLRDGDLQMPTHIFCIALAALLAGVGFPSSAQEGSGDSVQLKGELPLRCSVELVGQPRVGEVVQVEHYCNAPHMLTAVVIDADAAGPWRGQIRYRGRNEQTNEFGHVEFYFPSIEGGVWPLAFDADSNENDASEGAGLPKKMFVSLEVVPD